ncbi:MAG: Lrp/AsnC family transcriptional regulator [Actinomycetota bacterium]|nr:Lrp/AsnC family transcriptional regulator [Actinomycetota bacterium]
MARKPKARQPDRQPDPDARLDDADLALLAALRDEGRTTIQALAALAGIGSATASVRVQSLRNRKVIRGIHARIDYSALGYALCAYVLLEVKEVTGRRGGVSRQLLALPEVEEVAWITGEYDVILKIWAKDTSHLEAIVVSIDEIGARSKTLIVLGEGLQKSGITFEAPVTKLEPGDP